MSEISRAERAVIAAVKKVYNDFEQHLVRRVDADDLSDLFGALAVLGAAEAFDPSARTSIRPNWDEYFLAVAGAVSARAECTRRKVGAIIVRENRLLVAGYNGAPAKQPSCLQGACPRGQKSVDEVPAGSSYDTGPGTCIALHAEMNAIASAAEYGISVKAATLYVTDEPCGGCRKLIAAVGLSRVVWPTGSYTA